MGANQAPSCRRLDAYDEYAVSRLRLCEMPVWTGGQPEVRGTDVLPSLLISTAAKLDAAPPPVSVEASEHRPW